MPRRPPPDLSALPAPLPDTAMRGVRVLTATELGEVARAVRTAQLGNQEPAAAKMGITVGLLGAIERGDRGVHLNSVLAVLSDLGLDVVLVPRNSKLSLQGPTK